MLLNRQSHFIDVDLRELLLELGGRGLERCEPPLLSFQLRLLGVQLGLQARTIRTRLPCLGFHSSLCYVTGHNSAITAPVNGYAFGPHSGGLNLVTNVGIGIRF